MTIDRSTLLFCDASCLIAAALAVHAEYLLTLDPKLATEVNQMV